MFVIHLTARGVTYLDELKAQLCTVTFIIYLISSKQLQQGQLFSLEWYTMAAYNKPTHAVDVWDHLLASISAAEKNKFMRYDPTQGGHR